MAKDEDAEFLHEQDIVLSIGEHINEFQEIATEIAEHRNFEGLAALHKEKWSAMDAPSDRFWRGADIEVVHSFPGDGKEDWHARVENPGYHMDEPCPSRFPLVVSGLIWRLQENAQYIDYTNKYEWYGTIAEACQELEARSSLPNEEEVCRTVIYRLTQLLVRWRDIILAELNTPLEPNLYDEGWKLYFGFGRNVNQKAMLSQDRCPNARFICLMPYENHRFAIDSRGYATIVEEKGKKVWGVLWAVPPQDLARLDLREGVRKVIYRRETRWVYFPIVGHDIDVEIYLSNSEEGSFAQDGYIEEIIEGFELLGANEQYFDDYGRFIKSPAQCPTPVLLQGREDIPKKEKSLKPKNTSLPLFAYGLFKANQPGHERIAKHVKSVKATMLHASFLVERDGLPLLAIADGSVRSQQLMQGISYTATHGEIINFKPGKGDEAYGAIARLEPKKQYVWVEIDVDGTKANTLIGRQIFRGTTPLDTPDWRMEVDDPFIAGVEEYIESVLASADTFLELQGAYMVLWSAMERIAALKFNIGKRDGDVERQVESYMAADNGITQTLNSIDRPPQSFRPIFRSDDPRTKLSFDLNDHLKCVKYLRQVRHNVVHRGKGAFVDQGLVEDAIRVVLRMFEAFRKC